jgi:AAA15 family ATPase/GTPase
VLLQFTVENVLSFRDRATLSMVAGPTPSGLESAVTRVDGFAQPISRIAAIYGPNASGKSNLVNALEMIRGLVVEGTRPDQPIAVVPFKLDDDSPFEESRFELELLIEGRRYSYGALVSSKSVRKEWLFETLSSGEERPLFERNDFGAGPDFEIGEGLEREPERRQFLKFVAQGTRPNQLYLTELAERNADELSSVTRWFRDAWTLVPRTVDARRLAVELLDSKLRSRTRDLLRAAGTGIRHIHFVAKSADTKLPEEQLVAKLAAAPDLRLNFHMNEGEYSLGFDEQSDGTRRLLELAPDLHAACSRPSLVVCDELDRSLHTLVSQHFLRAFLQSAAPESQLLFTTHDTNLLDANLLPRESIWFVEKDAKGGSSLYPLSDFKQEQLDALSSDLERGYLAGRFGAIPFLGDPSRLGWTSEPAKP